MTGSHCQLCGDKVFGVMYFIEFVGGARLHGKKTPVHWVDEGCYLMLSERGEILKVEKTIIKNKKKMIEEENTEVAETPEEDAAETTEEEAPLPEEE